MSKNVRKKQILLQIKIPCKKYLFQFMHGTKSSNQILEFYCECFKKKIQEVTSVLNVTNTCIYNLIWTTTPIINLEIH